MSFCAARIADDNAGEQLTRTLEAAKCDDREEDDGREHREEGRGAQLPLCVKADGEACDLAFP